MKTLIAVDVGTTSIKSIAFDEFGEVVHMERCATADAVKKNEPCYEPETIWQIVREQVQKLMTICKNSPVGISVTGMAEAGLIVKKSSGEAMTEILPWFDKRPAKFSDKADPDKEKELFERTGLRNSFKYGIYKLLWLKEQYNICAEDMVWLSVCDYIVMQMTEQFVTDPTFAARTYVYDIRRKEWDENRLREYGLSRTNFPRVVESGKIIGHYQGIPVALAGHDHILAAFDLLYFDKEKVVDSAGTSETYIGFVKEDEITYDSGLLYGPFVDGGYFYMANIPSSGHSIEWFRRKVQKTEIKYEEMNAQLKAMERKPSGLLYFPYLTGMGAPWYQEQSMGAVLGLTQEHGGMEILKGIIEGIQYQAKWLLSIVKKYHGADGTYLICSGGSTNNETMLQIKADILNAYISVPSLMESTLHGAAALYLYKNKGAFAAEQFMGKAMEVKKVVFPDQEYVLQYQELYQKEFLPLTKYFK